MIMNLETAKSHILQTETGVAVISVGDHVGFGNLTNEVESIKQTPYKWINFGLFTTNELIDMFYEFDFQQQFIVLDDVFQRPKAAKKAFKMIQRKQEKDTLFLIRCKPNEDIRELFSEEDLHVLEIDPTLPRNINENSLCFRWEPGVLHPKVTQYLNYDPNAQRKSSEAIFDLVKEWARSKY